MIRGMHAMFYSSDAAALRAFIKDKLGLPATDVGDGWLIFDAPEADLGIHPTGWSRISTCPARSRSSCISRDTRNRGGTRRLRCLGSREEPNRHVRGHCQRFGTGAESVLRQHVGQDVEPRLLA